MKIPDLIPFLLPTFAGIFRRRPNRKIDEIRQRWGQEIGREREMDRVSLYHRNLTGAPAEIDDRTWQDLGMDDLFAKVDRTVAIPGAQILYHQMRSYEKNDAELAERARQHRLFQQDAALREKIWPILAALDRPGAAWLAPLLLNPAPEAPRYAWLLYLSSALMCACLLGVIFFHPLLVAVLLLFFCNLIVNQTYGIKITPYFPAFVQIDTLLGAGEALAKIPDEHRLPSCKFLRASAAEIARLRKKFGWVIVDKNSLSEIQQVLFEYLNILFLFDIVVFLRSLTGLREHQKTLIGVLTAVGSVDAALSVASYLAGTSGVIVPTLTDGRHLQVSGLSHPLIEKAMGNSLNLDDQSALISGSNMAGKTTFIRTVGINLITARTLNFCHAERAVFPRAIVRSTIRREDRLNEGQSYFFAELKQLLDFINAGKSDALHLFLIDEIFRGTNTIERISASTAVLRHLAQHQIVLVTTHDIELLELLAGTFEMFHFSERFEDGKCVFDYRLQPGPARSRNAIKLLEYSGYPASITREAEALAEKLTASFEQRNISALQSAPKS